MAVTINATTDAIWAFLSNFIGNDYGVAGLMGNLFAESGCNPFNVENGFGWTDLGYTEAVDNGTENFTRLYLKPNNTWSPLGYGLAQWTSPSRKQALYDNKVLAGVSIADLNLQLNYLEYELIQLYPAVLTVLQNATTIRQASDYVLVHFEAPADQSEAVKILRASYGQEYYDHYHSAFILYRYGGIREMLRRLIIHA